MTFLLGMVASDGVILASDRRVINDKCFFRCSESTTKIIFNSSAMYCWSGDNGPGEVARIFLKNLRALELTKEALEDIAREQREIDWGATGNSYKCMCEGILLIAWRSESTVKLFSLNYGRQIRADAMSGYAHAGDNKNAAVFIAERYCRENFKVEELLPSAAHSVLMAGKLNPASVAGLDIAVWRNSESLPIMLSQEDTSALKIRSDSVDTDTLEKLVRPLQPQ